MATANQTVKKGLDHLNSKIGVGGVIESGTSADGMSWYKKFSDGRVIQGGITSSGVEFPVTFLVPYKDTSYTIFCFPKEGQNSGEAFIWLVSQTTSECKVHFGGGKGSSTKVSWISEGPYV